MTEPNQGRMVVTLGVEAAAQTRALAARLGVKPPEAVRRGLSLLRLWVSLGEDEALMVRRANGDLERLLLWE